MTEKKVWLITGAGLSLGSDIAKATLSAGHAVVAAGCDAAKVSRWATPRTTFELDGSLYARRLSASAIL